MSDIGVVIHRPLCETLFAPRDRARLEFLGQVRWFDGQTPATPEQAASLLAGCAVGLGSWGTPHPGQPVVAAACPDLRLWEHAAGTVKHMFQPHLRGRDLLIASCKTAIADSVAEMTLGEIILGRRGVPRNALANRTVGADRRAGCGAVLYDATVGVVGASEVGRRVIALLRPFRCRILLHDPHCPPERATAMGAERVSDLLALCRACDVLTLHTPYLPTTHHLLGAEHFRALPDHAVFINTARGACIDEAALVGELARGRLSAFLDVSDPEPAAEDSPLRRLDNVVYTSHIAGPRSTSIGAQAVDDIAAFLAGKRPQAVIGWDDLATTA